MTERRDVGFAGDRNPPDPEQGARLEAALNAEVERIRAERRLRDLRGDGCELCGSFAHPSGDCPGEG